LNKKNPSATCQREGENRNDDYTAKDAIRDYGKKNPGTYCSYKSIVKDLANKKSSICGYSGSTSVLHFHHIIPSHKIADIGKFISERDYYGTISELWKCTILCANCHSLYHNSNNIIKKIMEEKFVKVDIDAFLQICKEYGASEVDNNTNHNLDLVKRIITLEHEVKALKMLLKKEPKNKIKIETTKTEITKTEVIQYTNNIEEIIVETFKRTNSFNKSTQAAYGKGKKGRFYINKVKPILHKYGLIT